MPVETQKEHQWLQRMAGEWSFEIEAEGPPGEPPVHHSGTESVRSLQGVWMPCESQGVATDGGTEISITTLGYDPSAQRFTGTFITSMMTHLWVYSGTRDAGGTVLTLDTEGPSYSGGGGMTKYHDTIELRSDDYRVHASAYQRDDGTWHQFMTMHYRRTA